MTSGQAAAGAVAYIGLGANLGDSASTLRAVLAELAEVPGISACTASPFYRSAPVDADGPDYVNAVARICTTLTPMKLLSTLQGLENRHGRQRPYRHAPRTLDLDLLLHGDVRLDSDGLTLPHPRMHQRAFVLQPLRDLEPGLVLTQGALDDLLAQCTDQALQRLPQADPG
jgi:2-amino-4-hydroxy-6-hydroxymethyldihydropteridine diphosphokinase